MMAAVWLTVLARRCRAPRQRLGLGWLTGSPWPRRFCSTCTSCCCRRRTSFSSVVFRAQSNRTSLRFAIASVLAVCAAGAVPGDGRRPGASDQMGRTDRAPNASKTWRCSSISSEARRSRCCRRWWSRRLLSLWLSKSAQLARADRQLLTLAIAWLVIPTAADRDLVGAGSPDLHAALFVLHRAGDGTGPGRLHRRIGRQAMG